MTALALTHDLSATQPCEARPLWVVLGYGLAAVASIAAWVGIAHGAGWAISLIS